MAETLKHSSLGEMKGVAKGEVIQYLGVKYATLKDKFAVAELWNGNDGLVDATHLGPSVISPPSGCDMEYTFVQHTLSKPSLPQSDIDGLNLNITVPKEHVGQSRLPVIVFIHGGGFAVGSNAWPQYDLANVVRLATEKDMPIVGININYRLGAFGFLTSEEMTNAGYKGNNGLHDQRTALQWIKAHIHGFGGDPENVTLIGESAGGASTTVQLSSTEPLFKRLMSMGGTSLLMRSLPPAAHEVIYDTVIDILGLKDLPSEDRIAALVKMPSEELFLKIPPQVPLLPLIDGNIIPSPSSFQRIADRSETGVSELPGKAWCKDLLIGDCQSDSSIFSYMIEARRSGIAKAFIESVKRTLHDHAQEAELLLKAYDITTTSSDDEAYFAVLRFANDIAFFAPVLTYAEGWPGRAYVYAFNEPNPWDGAWKGHATHILDVSYLFLNYNEYLSDSQKAVAFAFAEDMIKFANGIAPWPQFEASSPQAKVYGPSDETAEGARTSMVTVLSKEMGRRDTIFQFKDSIGLDRLSQVWGAFMAGK